MGLAGAIVGGLASAGISAFARSSQASAQSRMAQQANMENQRQAAMAAAQNQMAAQQANFQNQQQISRATQLNNLASQNAMFQQKQQQDEYNRKTANDASRAAAKKAEEAGTIGPTVGTGLGGLSTIYTSPLGDTSAAYTGRNKLLGS